MLTDAECRNATCPPGKTRARLVLSRCQLISVFGVGTDASSSNGTDLSCQCIKLVGKRQLDTAFQQ